jgi:hypothetical protein
MSRRCNAPDSAARVTFPATWDELVEAGGPDAFIRRAEREAGDHEARNWLATLEGHKLNPDDGLLYCIVESWIKSLRRRLHEHPSPEAVRAQTRERVRQFRERKAAQRP